MGQPEDAEDGLKSILDKLPDVAPALDADVIWTALG